MKLFEECQQGATGPVPEESQADYPKGKMIILGDGEIPGQRDLEAERSCGDEGNSQERAELDLTHFC